MLEEVANCDHLAIRTAPLGEERRHRFLEPEPPVAHQLHDDRRRRHHFGQRGKVKRCLKRRLEGVRVERQPPEGALPYRTGARADFHGRRWKHARVDRIRDNSCGRVLTAGALAKAVECRHAGRGCREVSCTTHAQAIVVTAPMKTYQVNATEVQPQTTVMTMRPATMPMNVGPSSIDGASVPSRKAPSTDPDA